MLQITEKETTNTTVNPKEQFYTMLFECSGIAEKKDLLKELSEIAKMKMETGETEHAKVNDVLVEMYTSEKHKEFNTFHGWKKEGFKVKKGEKGFFIWSNPLKGKKKNEEEKNEKESTFKFFGLAHIFSNAQVEPLKD